MKLSKSSVLIIFLFILTVLFWVSFISYTKYTATYEGFAFDYLLKPFLIGMTVLPLLGGILGLRKARKWGGSKSAVGKVLLFLSAGLITWSGGMVVWNYYLFFTSIEVPYPSLADAIFILSWPSWMYGLWHISRVAGIKFALRTIGGKVLLLLIPIATTVISYVLLVLVARGGVLDLTTGGMKLFFDLFYPLGDAILFTGTVLIMSLSHKLLGGKLKGPIVTILVGFIFNYFTDFIFSYTTTVETYFNGHVVDFLFLSTMFVLSLGINNIDPDL